MSKSNQALTTPGAKAPPSNGAFINLLNAETNLISIGQRLDAAFTKAVFERAEQVGKADPANLDNFVNLITAWEQQNDNYKKSKAALSSFQTAVGKLQEDEVLRHPKESLAAATAKREALQADLNERTAGDDVIKKEIARLDKLINSIKPPDKPKAYKKRKPAQKRRVKQLAPKAPALP